MTVTSYDTTALAGLTDPYPEYARLRAEGPVLPAGPGGWVVTRYADVARLLVDPHCGHEFPEAVYRRSGEPDELTAALQDAEKRKRLELQAEAS